MRHEEKIINQYEYLLLDFGIFCTKQLSEKNDGEFNFRYTPKVRNTSG